MPGLYWDLNLRPDLLAASKRLSFSDADADSPSPGGGGSMPRWGPGLATIGEGDELAAAQAPALSQCTSPQSLLGMTGALYPAQRETAPPAAGAPVATCLSLAPPGQSQPQQSQEAVAAVMMLEQRRRQNELRASYGEYQRQLQQLIAAARMLEQRRQALEQRRQALAAEAGLQQAWASAWAARPQSQVLMLYTVDGGAAGYATKWEELHPVSQGLLLQIEEVPAEFVYDGVLFPTVVTTWCFPPGSGCGCEFEDFGIDLNGVFLDQIYCALFEVICANYPTMVNWFLLDFRDNIREYRDDSERLDQCSHLDDPSSSSFDAGQITQVEHIHQCVEMMKTQYLNDRRCRSDLSNPFLKANRREEAKQEAAARIIHPMLHLSPPGQPTTLVAVPMISNQLEQTSFPTVPTSPSSYPTLAMPSVLPPSSTQTSPAPLTSPFSSPGSVLQSTPFGSFSTLAAGAMPAASLFGTGIPYSATSLFPIPSGGGTAASGINPVPSTGKRSPRRNY
ncbi:hypothetical protein BAE44_0006346 [Dichanthelium oligosanthes]|uniref:Uncharacterized protein n=1 Tax=Dichanthelium oligosanthes TaxID=888268 RepID=A0A1E5W5T8_9POAL|nr:hypothetical protein BAE44_0006346 [Dichanthelium oligosanthes]